jgi:hypothetical protein
VVYDLRTRLLKWSQHLDMSTDTTRFRAYAYAAPTLVDVDRWVPLTTPEGGGMRPIEKGMECWQSGQDPAFH